MTQTSPDYKKLMARALIEIKDLKAQLNRQKDVRSEPVAVIGMSCRFPGGADSPEEYWNILENGINAISEMPKDRWDIDRFYDPDPGAPGKTCTKKGGFIKDLKGFDAGFFGISPRECESMDPHQRILLEVSWEALEHAGIIPEHLFGSNTGVFIGVSSVDNMVRLLGEAPLKETDAYYGTGCAMAPIAGRVSYNFGFTGPSFVVDTACSSSLLSLHLAAESLRRKECDLALGGGVHLLFHPGVFVAFSQARMLSPDGFCKTFDASANGYSRGEGCGVIVLKRLSDAIRDNDPVIALIRGSAVNQDGASGGLTVPSGPSQEQVIKLALTRAGMTPRQINYIEAHGTGTPLGDPIEVGALANVLCRERTEPLIVG
ncbi:beta-ketoacyl synthase N-terminal-like domain-containing protein, partial [Desulfamplus magnetovallimortis]|uniref:beta-ketoacyl synthase N-terminal-like domain-containing protein n=1 Tax=Desulfamplus magnetovallimortis TaxID=1246637 RepID=UPI001C972135